MDTYNPFAQHQKQQGKTPGTQPTTPSQRAPMKNKQRTLTPTLTNAHTNNTSQLQKTTFITHIQIQPSSTNNQHYDQHYNYNKTMFNEHLP